MSITHVFFDIGGVLGSNGWDAPMRAAAAAEFTLDPEDFAERHEEAVGSFEQGRMSLDEYLDATVFYRPRPFSRDAFRAFMFAQSVPYPDTIRFARSLERSGRYRLMTLNNESQDLNVHRVQQFGLVGIFTTFFSSCWVGVLKPSRRIYELALAMSQADAGCSVLVDDRERNLEPARALGMQGVLFTGVPALARDLAALGVTP
ncbi:MAG TPA: HAD family phosphatase [Gemmatimonadales bacterium]|nr:HAD family phosphatase [Gemmatimonadales bacterium]